MMSKLKQEGWEHYSHTQTPQHTQGLSSILIDTKGVDHKYKLEEIGLPTKFNLKTKPLQSTCAWKKCYA